MKELARGMRLFLVFVFLVLCTGTIRGAAVRESSTGSNASETSCSLLGTSSQFEPSTRQVFFRAVLQGIRRGDRLRVDWLDPQGNTASSAPFEELPTVATFCLVSQMQVGGFPPASQPGQWTVRLYLNGLPVHERGFRILPDRSGGLSITRLEREDLPDKTVRFVLQTAGAHSETTINLAQYTDSGGWKYLAHLLPESMDGSRITVNVPALAPAEYVVILRNPDGRQSTPARFLISTDSGYRLPSVLGRPWVITQGPYGSYSHWGRAVHAWDLAPREAVSRESRYVVAMRPGVVSAFDLGLGQTPNRRIFGNYITLKHDDGEYSHYAHLKSGSFLVRNGQRVEQGQPLAEVGTSGYSFGVHLHVQVTKSFSISSPSIPFRFEDFPAGRALSYRGPVVSSNRASTAASEAPKDRRTGSLTLAEWWTSLLSVPSGAGTLRVWLGWEEQDNDFDLYLVSPSGRQYTSAGQRPEVVQVPDPEPGAWRISVQAVHGSGVSLPFWVDHEFGSPGRGARRPLARTFR